MQMRSQPPPSPHRNYSHAPDLCLLPSALTWGIDECSLARLDLEFRFQSRRPVETTLVLAMTTKLRNEEEDTTSIENDFSSLSLHGCARKGAI